MCLNLEVVSCRSRIRSPVFLIYKGRVSPFLPRLDLLSGCWCQLCSSGEARGKWLCERLPWIRVSNCKSKLGLSSTDEAGVGLVMVLGQEELTGVCMLFWDNILTYRLAPSLKESSYLSLPLSLPHHLFFLNFKQSFVLFYIPIPIPSPSPPPAPPPPYPNPTLHPFLREGEASYGESTKSVTLFEAGPRPPSYI